MSQHELPRTASFGFIRTLVFSLLPLIVFLTGVELVIRVSFYQKHAPYRSGLAELYYTALSVVPAPSTTGSKTVGAPLFRVDPVTGYSYIPGIHELSIVHGDKTLKYRVVIGPDGYRTATPNPDSFAGKPELWIFGCSFTFGTGVNNEDTFAWLLQKEMPGWRVRNLGGEGFGNLQALLQLNDAVEKGSRLPKVALFVYDNFHPIRNVGAPSWLRAIRQTGGPLAYSYPGALLNDEGNFTIEWAPLKGGLWESRPEPAEADAILLTQIVFYRLWKLSSARGILPVLGIQVGTLQDPVVQYARSIGFTIVDFSVPLREFGGYRYTNVPFDGHPNKSAHLEYARRLLPKLTELESRATDVRR